MASSRKPVGHLPRSAKTNKECPAGFACLAELSAGQIVPLYGDDESTQPRCNPEKIQAAVTK
jgi:hypothetical protein